MQNLLKTMDPPELPAEALDAIAELVYRHTGIRLGAGKGYFVEGRLAPLYRYLGCRSWQELPRRFNEREAESLTHLIQAVITPETRFFRDGVPFRALTGKVLPELVNTRGSPAPLRVWSAGCSTGQEPYSILMALWDLISTRRIEPRIWATDICHRSLERGRKGVYAEHELHRGVDVATRERFFDTADRGMVAVKPALRQYLQFEQLNLLADRTPRRRFDLVFCRNVAIYFDREGKRRLYGRLAEALVDGGYLFLGAAETLHPSVEAFETLYFERSLLFRRRPRGKQ